MIDELREQARKGWVVHQPAFEMVTRVVLALRQSHALVDRALVSGNMPGMGDVKMELAETSGWFVVFAAVN